MFWKRREGGQGLYLWQFPDFVCQTGLLPHVASWLNFWLKLPDKWLRLAEAWICIFES